MADEESTHQRAAKATKARKSVVYYNGSPHSESLTSLYGDEELSWIPQMCPRSPPPEPEAWSCKVEHAGTGEPALNGDTVICRYWFTLVDGIEVDSTDNREEPMQFRVGSRKAQTLPGWTKVQG